MRKHYFNYIKALLIIALILLDWQRLRLQPGPFRQVCISVVAIIIIRILTRISASASTPECRWIAVYGVASYKHIICTNRDRSSYFCQRLPAKRASQSRACDTTCEIVRRIKSAKKALPGRIKSSLPLLPRRDNDGIMTAS